MSRTDPHRLSCALTLFKLLNSAILFGTIFSFFWKFLWFTQFAYLFNEFVCTFVYIDFCILRIASLSNDISYCVSPLIRTCHNTRRDHVMVCHQTFDVVAVVLFPLSRRRFLLWTAHNLKDLNIYQVPMRSRSRKRRNENLATMMIRQRQWRSQNRRP